MSALFLQTRIRSLLLDLESRKQPEPNSTYIATRLGADHNETVNCLRTMKDQLAHVDFILKREADDHTCENIHLTQQGKQLSLEDETNPSSEGPTRG